MKRLLPIATLLFALPAACGEDPTQIIIVIDSDLDEGTEIDAVRVNVEGMTSAAGTGGPIPLPRTLALTYEGSDSGSLGPFEVRVTGSLAGVSRFDRVVRVSFVKGETLMLPICLAERCLAEARSCAGMELVCSENGCVEPDIPSLPLWTGEVPTDVCSSAPPVDGGSDAEMDAEADAGVDVPPGCLIDAVCNVTASVLPGDELDPEVCTPTGSPLQWRFGPAGSLADVTPPFRVDQPGAYRLEVEQTDIPCTVGLDVTVTGFDDDIVPDIDRPTREVRDLAARVGTAFIAGRDGPYGLRDSWVDLRDAAIATGDVAVEDLRAVGVLNDPVFGPNGDRDGFWRIATDLTSANHSKITIAGDRITYAIGTRLDGTTPVAVGTKDGVVVLEGAALNPRSVNDYDIQLLGDIAIGAGTVARAGDIWVMNRVDGEILDVSSSGGATLSGGTGFMPPTIGMLAAIAIDDRDASRVRLYVCGESGLLIYDLDSGVGAPLATLPMTCRDIAIDENGDAWVANSIGLSRVSPGGDLRLSVPRTGGVDFVATAWDESTREVWVYTDDRNVRRLSASP